MTVALLDLSAERWQLIKLMIALLQPLLVLSLIGGFVLASAHLLTMIGTRWGDRRASSKAMLFSLGIHFLLACGIVALIPEYRSKVFARLMDLDVEPIRITIPEATLDLKTDGRSGGHTSLFDRVPVTPPPEWNRLDPLPEAAGPDAPLEKMTAAAPHPLAMTPDAALLPDIAPPAPAAAPPPDSPPLTAAATATSQPERIEREALPDPQPPARPRERAPPAVQPVPESPPAARPDPGSVDRVAPEPTPDRGAPDLAEIPLPDAVLPQPDDGALVRREGPQLSVSEPERIGRATDAETAPDRNRVDPAGRTPPRTPATTQSLPAEPARSPLPPTAPAAALQDSERNELSLPPRNDRPQLARQTDPFTVRAGQDQAPSAYRLRTDEEREQAILKFGGSDETEAAVDRSLKWLASVQQPAGYWDASEHGARQMGVGQGGQNRLNLNQESEADVGVTALAVLAFLGKLHTVERGEYSPVVNRALRWIVAQQTSRDWGGAWGQSAGYLGGRASEFEGTYCHAMATFALAEAYAMSRDNVEAQWLRAPLERAVGYIVETQIRDGGWRYVKGQPDGDMSIFGWQLMALRSAQAAGISVPAETQARMRRFLTERKLGRAGGLAAYRHIKELNGQLAAPTAAMTAEALYCRQMLGMADDEAANREAVQFLLENSPRRAALNYYYWYYGTLAMYQHGGPEWERWNLAVRDLLVSEQRQQGPLAGSWDPRDAWGAYGGRIYATALATLSLEVYYRYLPLYRLHEN